jgi:ketosteroid isomerase-like protein
VTIEFVDVHDVVGGDDHVVGLLRIRVTGPGEFTNPAVFVMHVRDGKLTEFWAMNDNQAEFDKAIEG